MEVDKGYFQGKSKNGRQLFFEIGDFSIDPHVSRCAYFRTGPRFSLSGQAFEILPLLNF